MSGPMLHLEEKYDALWKRFEEMRQRAEHAERELGEATVRLGVARAARECAEADNAAMLAECVRHEASEECRESMRVVTDADHPGAALLERLRALEEAWTLTRGLFEDLSENGYGADAPFTSQEEAARVLARINALKVPRE